MIPTRAVLAYRRVCLACLAPIIYCYEYYNSSQSVLRTLSQFIPISDDDDFTKVNLRKSRKPDVKPVLFYGHNDVPPIADFLEEESMDDDDTCKNYHRLTLKKVRVSSIIVRKKECWPVLFNEFTRLEMNYTKAKNLNSISKPTIYGYRSVR